MSVTRHGTLTSTSRRIVRKTVELFEDEDEPVFGVEEWTDQMETKFFQAFISKKCAYKPVGVNKHFNMLIAYHRFIKSINRNVDIEVLWNKLESLYDLDELEMSEYGCEKSRMSFPFPNEQVDFKLPDNFRLDSVSDKKSATKRVRKESSSSNSSNDSSKKMKRTKRRQN